VDGRGFIIGRDENRQFMSGHSSGILIAYKFAKKIPSICIT
jgi:hypothetical protein